MSVCPRQIPECNRSRENAVQIREYVAGCCCKGHSTRRKCSLSHHRSSCESAWETRHVRRDAEWHPKRATSRATDTVNITFGARTFIGCYTRSPSRNIFQTCQAESPVLSHSGPKSTALVAVAAHSRLVTHNS